MRWRDPAGTMFSLSCRRCRLLRCRNARSPSFTHRFPAVVCFACWHWRHEQDFGVAFTDHLPSFVARRRFRSCPRRHPVLGTCRRLPYSAVLYGRSTAWRSNQCDSNRGGECETRTHRRLLAKHPCAPAHSPCSSGCVYSMETGPGFDRFTLLSARATPPIPGGRDADIPSCAHSCGFLAWNRQFA